MPVLQLYIGPAGSGKPAAVMELLRERVQAGKPGGWLIVPEQYSHEAERELCRRCGDTMSRYAEVFSFSGLARRVLSEQGGAAKPVLDKGGRLLCMSLALSGVGERLTAYRAARRRPEFPALMLSAVDELKSACVSPDMLQEASERSEQRLGDKLRDAALVLEAYDAVASNGRIDPADRLELLKERLPACLSPDMAVCIDGFIDFTGQERELLRVLLQSGACVTVCLTLDSLDGEDEIFALSRRAARSLTQTAEELAVPVSLRPFAAGEGKDPALSFFTERLFRYTPERFEGETGAIRLTRARSMAEECEFAAARALELARSGSRWRDIAVAARGFEDYRPLLENAFRHYGVPLYVTRRSELLQKPLPALLSLAYEILETGWELDDVVSYLRTGLTGLDADACDKLENYIYKWQLRGSAWQRRGDWKQHPDGYGAEVTEESEARLAEINALRRRAAGPLLALERRGREANTAAGQAAALAHYFEDLHLPETLAARAEELQRAGQERLAAEYRQLWELVVSALEQCEAILGEAGTDLGSFGKLFLQMLSQYDVGTIPVSLDRVAAGDFDRMRRRSLRHLIVLGASDDRLPLAGEQDGLFSDDEREELLRLGIDLGGAGEAELWREFALIYHVLTLPSETLDLCCPAADSEGSALRPSIVVNRAKALFSLPLEDADPDDCRTAAPGPALTLAANALRGGGKAARAAAAWARAQQPERMAKLEAAAAGTRGRLSPPAVEAPYGRSLYLSASRIDKFASCRYAYFCQYGLKAQPTKPAGFTAPEVGTFLHFILERCAAEAKARGGFRAVTDAELRALVKDCVADYAHRELNDFQEKSARFVHLYERLGRSAERIVLDTAAELRVSEFAPLDFELDFSKARDLPPAELGEGQGSLTLTGVADRVDGWLHEGKLYLRVVDYKTGHTRFSLSDVWYGKGLQLLLYLFSLEAGGETRYGYPIVPAGVMILPARDLMLASDRPLSEEETEKERLKELRRSGLVLRDEGLIEAWEKGEDKRYIPVVIRGKKSLSEELIRSDELVGGLARAEQLGRLSRHIRTLLGQMARELRQGSIAADPYYRSGADFACQTCDFYDACQFAEGENGEKSRYQPKLGDGRVWELIEEEAAEHG